MKDRFTASPPGAETLHLDFDFATPKKMDGVSETTYHDVRDYRVRGEVTAAAGAEVGVEMTVRDVRYRVVLPTGSATARVDFPRDLYTMEVLEEGGTSKTLPSGSAVNFEVAHWDWGLEVRVDGEVWFSYRLNPKPWSAYKKGARWPEMFKTTPKYTALRLSARGGSVAFEDLAVDQDIHYTQPYNGVWDTLHYTFMGKKLPGGKIPEGYYFMMGDNSHGSRDSRLWHRIQVEKKPRSGELIWGEEYSWSLDSDHMHNERVVNFVDLNGNGYLIPNFTVGDPLDEQNLSKAVKAWEPFGLIPRHHLMGRALCVFWPFPPFYREFRPKLVR